MKARFITFALFIISFFVVACNSGEAPDCSTESPNTVLISLRIAPSLEQDELPIGRSVNEQP